MKNPKIFLIVWLIGHGWLLTAQTNPVAVDLYSNGVKLDAKFYPANDISKAPAVILLHGFPGNQSSPLGLAEDPLNRKLLQVNKENTNIKGFETDHRFGNVMDELAGVIIEWIRGDSDSKNKTIDEIFKTEKAFEKMTAEKGIAEAFYYYADENAVIKRENDTLISGKENIKNYYEKRSLANATVNWEPDFIDVSASGDLAYTYGKYTWKVKDDSGKIAEFKGIFHTVWKRQQDGSWKYVWD